MDTDTSSITWNFFGRVVPERTAVSAELPTMAADVPGFGLKVTFGKLIIWKSQVITSITINRGTADIHTLRNLLADHVRSFLDLIGHQAGLALELDLDLPLRFSSRLS